MILKGPQNIASYTTDLLFTNSARNAWKHIIKFFNFKFPNKILLPAYIGFTDREGSGVFDPIIQTKTPYDFYLLNKDLTFNLNNIEEKFKKGDIRMFLIIHYFGFCLNDVVPLKNLCKKYNVILVEDCAHSFTFGNKNFDLGYYGDFAFYSIHKFLPTNSGGILMINNQDYLLPSIPKSEECDKEVLFQLLKSNFKDIINIRRENYHYLQSKISNIEEIQIMYDLKKNIIPQSFPIIFKKISREKIYFNLMERGVPTISLYYRLISQIDETKYPISYEISNSILNLPVHQDTTKSDIDYLVDQLSLAIKEINK